MPRNDLRGATSAITSRDQRPASGNQRPRNALISVSLKKLSAAIPEFSSPPEVIGVWRSEPIDLYGAGPQIMTMTITEVVSGRPVGFLRFADTQGRPATPELGIIQGKLAGNKLSFSYDGGVRRNLSSGGPSVPVQESMSGEVSKKEIRFAYERDGSGTILVIVRR